MKSFDFDLIIDLLRADGSITVNKNLIQAIGLNEAVLYCELLSRYIYFRRKNLLDDEGYFYNTQYDLQAGTGLGEKAQRTAINNLKEYKLIKVELKGMPAKRHFAILSDGETLSYLLRTGKEKLERLADSTDTSIGGNLKRRKKESDTPKGSNLLPPKEVEIIKNIIPKNNINMFNGSTPTEMPRDTSVDNFNFNIFNKQIETVMDGISDRGSIGNFAAQDVKEFFEMYYRIGSAMRGIEPIKLKNEQIEKVVRAIAYIDKVEYEPDLDDYEMMIRDYFKQKFEDCDYSINHFISGDVLLMRYYNLQKNKV